MEKHLTITGGQSFTQKHWKFCLDKIRSGEFDPTFVISHYLTLSQVPDFYKQFDDKEVGALKCFVRPENFTRNRGGTLT
jgi:threonine dehydrogenase-like Zn-dependent dehydrogenase